jgi:hypothetical protein
VAIDTAVEDQTTSFVRGIVNGAGAIDAYVEKAGWPKALFGLGTVIALAAIAVRIFYPEKLDSESFVGALIFGGVYVTAAFALVVMEVRSAQRSVEIANEAAIRAERRVEQIEARQWERETRGVEIDQLANDRATELVAKASDAASQNAVSKVLSGHGSDTGPDA